MWNDESSENFDTLHESTKSLGQFSNINMKNLLLIFWGRTIRKKTRYFFNKCVLQILKSIILSWQSYRFLSNVCYKKFFGNRLLFTVECYRKLVIMR